MRTVSTLKIRRAGYRALGVLCLALSLAGCSSMFGGRPGDNWMVPILNKVMPPSPGQVARNVFNPYDPDKRREAISLLSAAPFGGAEPYVKTYRLLVDDEDASVRAAAIKALGLHGTPADVPYILRRADDSNSFVRWEVALALQKIHDASAVPVLIKMATDDEDADVRMAAARALGQYPQRRVFSALVGCLDDPDFGVVTAAHRSLVTLTGYDFGVDASLWLVWSDKYPDDLFDHQEEYLWQPFIEPRTFLQKLAFWRKYVPPAPRPPAGLQVASTTPAP